MVEFGFALCLWFVESCSYLKFIYPYITWWTHLLHNVILMLVYLMYASYSNSQRYIGNIVSISERFFGSQNNV